jgi:glyoxylate reductase
MTTIYCTHRIPEVGIQMLRDKGYEVDIADNEHPLTREQLLENLKKKPYDGVITLLTDHIDGEVFNACPTAKIWSNYAVGFNNIDCEKAKECGVTATNTAGTSSRAVAEHAVALMLALSTRLDEGDRFMREGKYKGWDPDLLIGVDLSESTIGLIGTGAIGHEVASILYKGFGAKIIYSDPIINKQIEDEFHAPRFSIEDTLRQADFVSLHVPLMKETTHLINKERLEMMKPTAFLINTARGPIVDEKALVEALKEKKIRGAGLDVFEFEPQVTEGLLHLENVIVTPHIASAREKARNAMSVAVANNLISFFETGKAINVVTR